MTFFSLVFKHNTTDRASLFTMPNSPLANLKDSEQISDQSTNTENEKDLNSVFSKLQNFFVSNILSIQTIWAASHFFTIFGTQYYFAGVVNGLMFDKTVKFYYGAISGSISTYLIVIYKTHTDKSIAGLTDEKGEKEELEDEEEETREETATTFVFSNLLKDENTHLLIFTILWLFTPISILKLVPFYLYSVLNISSYFTELLFPNTALSEALLPLINYFEFPLLVIASYFEILNFILLSKECYLMNNYYPLVIFIVTWVLRFEVSKACYQSVYSIYETLDFVLENFYLFHMLGLIWNSLSDSINSMTEYLTRQFHNQAQQYNSLDNKWK